MTAEPGGVSTATPPRGDAPAIVVQGLRKSYGEFEAVRGIDLVVERGEVFALLGPNGAGKTTTVEILEGYRARSAGEVSVLGYDPGLGERALKERIGIVLQETNIDRFLTVEEVIDLFRGYFPSPRPRDEVIELVGLSEARRTLVRRLSGGMQRRLDVAIGLAGDPELLFLDEPTTGFDPAARRGAWQMIRDLQALGKTVMLTTHYLDEAEELADRVAIIARGEIIAEGSPAEISSRDPASRIRFRLLSTEAQVLAGLPRLEGLSVGHDGIVTLLTTDPTRALYELTRWAVQHEIELAELSLVRPSLEEAYLRLVGATDQDAAAK